MPVHQILSCSSPRQSSERCSRRNGHIRRGRSGIWITTLGLEPRTEKLASRFASPSKRSRRIRQLSPCSYPYVLDPKRPPERHTAHLVLRKREHECWHLHDFITPLGESLSYVYSAAQP